MIVVVDLLLKKKHHLIDDNDIDELTYTGNITTYIMFMSIIM